MTDQEDIIDRLFSYIKADKENINKLLNLNERMMTTLEDHQLRIGRLEQALARKEKKVSRNPGDRES